MNNSGVSIIRLIVGLGNPSDTYKKTRHNAGFWFLDDLATRNSLKFTHDTQMHGLLAKSYFNDIQVFLLKPLTFMNHSGRSVGAVVRYYRIQPENTLVVHDELAFDVGVIKFKKKGGHGGHNGLRDIITHLNSREFCRLRIGIGHPGDSRLSSDYVLGNSTVQEEKAIREGFTKAIDLIPRLIQGDCQGFTNSLHT